MPQSILPDDPGTDERHGGASEISCKEILPTTQDHVSKGVRCCTGHGVGCPAPPSPAHSKAGHQWSS
eukprot:scaffold266578_cov50-Prasinocladus_malaysianus.AAC.1